MRRRVLGRAVPDQDEPGRWRPAASGGVDRGARRAAAPAGRCPRRDPSPRWRAGRRACSLRAGSTRRSICGEPAPAASPPRCASVRSPGVLDLPGALHLLDDELGVHPHGDPRRAELARGLEPGDQAAVLGDVVGRDADATRRARRGRPRTRRRARPRRSRPARGCRASRRRPRRRRDHPSQPGLGGADQDRAAVVAAHDLVRRRGAHARQLAAGQLDVAGLAAPLPQQRRAGAAVARGPARRAPAARRAARPRSRPLGVVARATAASISAKAASRAPRARACSASQGLVLLGGRPAARLGLSRRCSITSSSSSSSVDCRRARVAISCCRLSSSFAGRPPACSRASSRVGAGAHGVDVVLEPALLDRRCRRARVCASTSCVVQLARRSCARRSRRARAGVRRRWRELGERRVGGLQVEQAQLGGGVGIHGRVRTRFGWTGRAASTDR